MLINEMVIFYNVVQQGSFSQAAEILGVSKSFVSKHITKLEMDIKARLLNRSTRQLSLTEAGEILYQHCQSLSDIAEKGYDAIVNLRKQPSGTLKISVPPAFAVHVLPNIIIEYNKRYPEVKFNVVLESGIIDIVKQGYDFALRSAVLQDSTLISQKIISFRNFLCASPMYLKRYGVIKHPDELTEHIFATYNGKKSEKQIIFSQKNKQYLVKVNSHFQSNNLDLIAQMVASNYCLAILPEFMVKTLIENKMVVVCLPEFKLPESPLYVVYPERELVPLKVKAFFELLKAHLAKID